MKAALFPRGLIQPDGCYRFGSDALLLAAYANRIAAKHLSTPAKGFQVAELGSGCGASLIGLALCQPEAHCIGFESEAVLVEAARQNVLNMGLDERVGFMELDIDLRSRPACTDFQLVIANPPWLAPGCGRLPVSHLRQKALCQSAATLQAFCQFAAALLVYHGFFCLIVPPAILCQLFALLSAARLGLSEIWPLASFSGSPASRLLVMARKEAANAPRFLAPLNLHESGSKGKNWSQPALDFCPWLAPACNA